MYGLTTETSFSSRLQLLLPFCHNEVDNEWCVEFAKYLLIQEKRGNS